MSRGFNTNIARAYRFYMTFELIVFFFQAEDGIRDGTVTGVQTCALPIWPGRPRAEAPHSPAAARDQQGPDRGPGALQGERIPGGAAVQRRAVCASLVRRSEERRVGKECRSRWWRHHYKKIECKCRYMLSR